MIGLTEFQDGRSHLLCQTAVRQGDEKKLGKKSSLAYIIPKCQFVQNSFSASAIEKN